MTAAGVQNVLTKSLGSANPHNVIKATFDALTQLRDKGGSCCAAWQVGRRVVNRIQGPGFRVQANEIILGGRC